MRPDNVGTLTAKNLLLGDYKSVNGSYDAIAVMTSVCVPTNTCLAARDTLAQLVNHKLRAAHAQRTLIVIPLSGLLRRNQTP